MLRPRLRVDSSSRHGIGFEARVELLIERGFASVLWVTVGGTEHAVVAAHARSVRRNDAADADRLPHLAACLDAPPTSRRRSRWIWPWTTRTKTDASSWSASMLGQTEEVLARPLTPLVAGMGPFAGAIVRGDGSLRLALDVYALAPRVRALGRVPDGRISDFPSVRPA